MSKINGTTQHSRSRMYVYHSKNSQQATQNTRDTTKPTNNTGRAHMTDPNNAQPPRHGVIKRTIGGSLARSWPPPLSRRRRCCVLLLLLLLLLDLSAAAAANNRCAAVASRLCASVKTFVYFVCASLVRSRVSTRSQGMEASNGR